MRDYHKQALAVMFGIGNGEVNPYDMLKKIAEMRPSIIVKAHDAIMPRATAFEREIAEIVRSSNKIAAIKEVRAQTGVGLREAKKEVERIMEKYRVK